MSDEEDRTPARPELTPTRTLHPAHAPAPTPTPGRTLADDTVDIDPAPSTGGQRIGRFEVRDVLGSGGMGTVFDAHDPLLDREVAVKLMHPDVAARSERRLLREAKALARLSHPNVVQVYEAGTAEGRTFIAMELVRGQDLSRWQEKRHDWRACVEVYLQAGRGLAAAHARGIVHRDFKPSNCILDHDGGVRVLDFGLARSMGRSRSSWSESMSIDADGAVPLAEERRQRARIVGTIGYMSLEQLWGKRVDAKSDQFSFCVSLFEAVYGQLPFIESSVEAVAVAMSEGRIDTSGDTRGVPRRLWKLLERGLQAHAQQRWPSMNDLLRELERLLGRRRRRLWGALVGTGLSLAALTAAWLSREPPCEDPRAEVARAWSSDQREHIRRSRTQASESGELEETIEYLDAYAEQWVHARAELCVAERTEGHDPEYLDGRRRCLDEAHDGLMETGELLEAAEPAVVSAAGLLLRVLPDVTRCERSENFVSLRPLPEDEEHARKVHDLRLIGNHARLLLRAERNAEATAMAQSALAKARALGFGPLQADLQLVLGRLAHHRGDYEQAAQHLEQSYLEAMAHDHPQGALKAAMTLTYVVGDLLNHHETGLKWGLTAEGLARQPWVDPLDRIGAREFLANIYYEQGRFSLALDAYQQALTSRELHDPDDLRIRLTRANIGLVLMEQGRYDEALPVLYQVLDERRARPTSKGVAHAQLTLGRALRELGHFDEARALFERALGLYEQIGDGEHPGVVEVLIEQSRLGRDEGALSRALAACERAMVVARATLGPNHAHTADLWLVLGDVLAAHGQLDAARRHADRGVRILQQVLEPDHVYLGRALAKLGELEHASGDRATAREHLERALEILALDEGPPQARARARFALARVLHLYPGERHTAKGLALQARQTYDELGERMRAEVEAVDAWLGGVGELD